MGPSGPSERGAEGPSRSGPAPLELSPQFALRPEPFGGLAYHYGNRRLTFLRSPELVDLVRSLVEHRGVDEALVASGIGAARWPGFREAIASLLDADVLCERSDRDVQPCSPIS